VAVIDGAPTTAPVKCAQRGDVGGRVARLHVITYLL
jgi:hypothetical protein